MGDNIISLKNSANSVKDKPEIIKNVFDDYKSAEMQILVHHVYEYKKGLRNLVLHTISHKERESTEELLKRKGINYYTQTLSSGKINVFFGEVNCVEIIKSFGNKSLNEFTDEEDFILGTMLGYDRKQQCDRYLKRKIQQKDKLYEICKPTGTNG